MTYRRPLRSTYYLVHWAASQLGIPDANDERRRGAVDLFRSIYEAGRRRGRAEHARELAASLGILHELGPIDLPGHAATPRQVRILPVPGVPDYAAREKTGAIPARTKRATLRAKP